MCQIRVHCTESYANSRRLGHGPCSKIFYIYIYFLRGGGVSGISCLSTTLHDSTALPLQPANTNSNTTTGNGDPHRKQRTRAKNGKAINFNIFPVQQ